MGFKLSTVFVFLSLFAGLLLPGKAAAVPIFMDPNPVSISSILLGDFTLTYDGGDTQDNILNFTIGGPGGVFIFPSTALAALVFDGVDIIDSGETSDPDNVINGLTLPDFGTAAGLLLDFGSPSNASFFLQLSGLPTTATLYSVDLDDLKNLTSKHDILNNLIDSQPLAFSRPIPEPSSFFLFGVGALVVAGALRRKAA